ncbi:MAG: hypothetical protein ACO1OT_11515, partial [Heyndrickxia sp.]
EGSGPLSQLGKMKFKRNFLKSRVNFVMQEMNPWVYSGISAKPELIQPKRAIIQPKLGIIQPERAIIPPKT